VAILEGINFTAGKAAALFLISYSLTRPLLPGVKFSFHVSEGV
jgi:hypothetical protein